MYEFGAMFLGIYKKTSFVPNSPDCSAYILSCCAERTLVIFLESIFISPRTLQDYRDKDIIPYTQIAGKILYRLSDINRLLQENYRE
ncbi:Uncharacterised protein [Porphyromonas cangingivalis]|uniref:Helix-turn-helix domain-containing protein n=1 Tax=Porphyromonas cangingivalis TaxID=36874 RepID=A0A1T4L3G0_PORCN|nr:hypothetical protein SAMN02745205_01011 [Porphyromonas cangingivalis]SPY35426.1 Uncharacterised protein [Porphyromonas cangingivalis]VEJ03924.1 Uncharacterised protein [Porphyromonas cangingivalis]